MIRDTIHGVPAPENPAGRRQCSTECRVVLFRRCGGAVMDASHLPQHQVPSPDGAAEQGRYGPVSHPATPELMLALGLALPEATAE